MEPLHNLLKRQLKHYLGDVSPIFHPQKYQNFIHAVNQAYNQSDEDRALLERSLELSSQELLQANSEMQAVFQAFPDLFFRLSRDGVILDYKTENSFDLYALPENLTGKRIQDLPSGEKFQKAIEELQRTQSRVSLEYSLTLRGTKAYYEARLLPLLDDQIIMIIRNITARKQAEENLQKYAVQLERNNKELKDFAYVASHDLQEPLRKIQTFGDRLRSKCSQALGEAGNDYLHRMQNAAEHMQILITDLLSYSRVTTQERPLVSVDLNEALKQVLSDLEVRIEQVKGKIVAEPLPAIDADPVQMRQLFQNLISNALKFHRKDTPPVIRIYDASSKKMTSDHHKTASSGCLRHEFIVEDNGIGFDEKYLDRIFVVFQRLHGRTEYEGTGVGLAICRKIAERHGGTITARSILGEGSKFIVTLPGKQIRGEKNDD